jgi:sugar phosphate isomerase/epimerase
MQRLLNISTHPGEPEMFNNDWRQAEQFLQQWEFDGFELYPVGDYPCECIPAEIVTGLHLRFFVILAPVWRGDTQRLLDIFGDWESIDRFYGGRDAEWITTCYTHQLDLAHHLGCRYVVFHPVHCELEHIYDWQFPWKVNDTLDLCAEVINAATHRSVFAGHILFENLWWPGSFRLDSPAEYDYLLSRVEYPHCGIALDTGHLLNKNFQLKDEREAADYLRHAIDNLGEVARHIHTVHLTKSLSGDYIRNTRQIAGPFNGGQNFWVQLGQARHHVGQIDRHEPFETPWVAEIFEKIDPAHVVFEFTFNSMVQWEHKIKTQKQALLNHFWPSLEKCGVHQ